MRSIPRVLKILDKLASLLGVEEESCYGITRDGRIFLCVSAYDHPKFRRQIDALRALEAFLRRKGELK